MGKVIVKSKSKAKVKKKPVKAGSTNKGGDGGILTTKVLVINKKRS